MNLGKGLASLIPPRDNAKKDSKKVKPTPYHSHPPPFRAAEENYPEKAPVFQIEVDKIKPNPYQPRTESDEESLKELAQSIREVGIIQPLVVSKIEKETEKGREVEYQLIAGERRLRAAKMVGMERVPVVIKKLDTKEDKLLMALIENIQRSDLNPIEMAKAYARLQDNFNLTQREIAVKVGKSRESIANTLRLLNLPSHIKGALANGKINESQAMILLSIKDPTKQNNLFNKILEQKLTAKELRYYTKTKKSKENKISSKNRKEESFWEKQLEEKLSAPVKITKKGEKGKVVIKFFSKEEWHSLLNKLLGKISD